MESVPPEIFYSIVKYTDLPTGGILAQVNKLFNYYTAEESIWELLVDNFYQSIHNKVAVSIIELYSQLVSWYKVAQYVYTQTSRFNFYHRDTSMPIYYFNDENQKEFINYLRTFLDIDKFGPRNQSSCIFILTNKNGEFLGDVLFRLWGDAGQNYLLYHPHFLVDEILYSIYNIYMRQLTEHQVYSVTHNAGYTFFVENYPEIEYVTERERQKIIQDHQKYCHYLTSLI